MTTAIKVENLSKIYRLGQIGTKTLSRDIERWWLTRVMGKEDPFLKIGETNKRNEKGQSDVVFSLKNINFEIQQGEAIGIIGRNGAGKSTLLKILSRVTSPTTGKINIKGRVASLLEVGTGFHPELTGKENIYLNGAILGMRKKEIDRKFDEIVDFSGVERYIDTPVKRYSSGMYVRLAFAVAAHLESEIMIVDEVLAVGDAEFQKKCLGKMGEVSRGEGRTVLFVSHNLDSISKFCQKTILMKEGNIVDTGETERVISSYVNRELTELQSEVIFKTSNKGAAFSKVNLQNHMGEKKSVFLLGDKIIMGLQTRFNEMYRKCDIGFHIKRNGIIIHCSFESDIDAENSLFKNEGEYNYKLELPTHIFKAGSYTLDLFMGVPGVGRIAMEEDAIGFQISEEGIDIADKSYSEGRAGLVYQVVNWEKTGEYL